MTSYENTPGAGAEPGLLRSHLRDAAVLCMGTEQRAPAQAGRRRSAAPGTHGRLAGSSCTALLEREQTRLPTPSLQQRHTTPAP